MKFSKQFSRRVRSDGELQQEEQSEISMNFVDNEVNITIEYDVENAIDSTREATTIHAESIDIRDIREISKCLSEWCKASGNGSQQIETGFIEGKCVHDGAPRNHDRLRIRIIEDRIEFQSVENNSTVGQAVIPASHQTEDDESSFPVHHHEFDLLLRTALHCAENQNIGSGPWLDPAGEFSGPIDREIRDRCLPMYFDNRGVEAVSVAGQALEKKIRSLDIQTSDDSIINIIGELFGGDDPELVASSQTSENKGVQFLFQGSVKALRNPLTHRDPSSEQDRFLDSFSRRYARDILYFYDLLFLLLANEIKSAE